MNDNDPSYPYREAFAFIVGYIATADKFGLPVNTKSMFQSVYDNYGVHPVKSICEELGLKISKDTLEKEI